MSDTREHLTIIRDNLVARASTAIAEGDAVIAEAGDPATATAYGCVAKTILTGVSIMDGLLLLLDEIEKR